VCLVVLRDEGPRHALIEPIPAAKQGKIEQECRQPPVQGPADRAPIETRAGVEAVIEQFDETARRALAMFPEENSGKRRSQGKRVEGRDRYGKSDCQRELPEENSGGSRE